MVVPGANQTFLCLSFLRASGIDDFSWLLNGTSLKSHDIQVETFNSADHVGTMILLNIPLSYNSTKIQCLARSRDTNSVHASTTSFLQVQGSYKVIYETLFNYAIIGLLPAVSDLQVTTLNSTTVSLTWEPPFILDIAGINHDITGYCVDVEVVLVNSTTSVTLLDSFGITETHFEYILLPNQYWCASFEFTVTPLNMAGSGRPETSPYIPVTRTDITFCIMYSYLNMHNRLSCIR